MGFLRIGIPALAFFKSVAMEVLFFTTDHDVKVVCTQRLDILYVYVVRKVVFILGNVAIPTIVIIAE